MVSNPAHANWYLADIVEQITVEGDNRSVVHTNMVLVRANSPDEAYVKALQLGMDAEQTYENSGGQRVRCRFRGLHDLNVIHDKLEHGAEIGYSKAIGMKDSAIKDWIRPKHKLAVFLPRQRPGGPDYADGEIMQEVVKAMRTRKKKNNDL